MAWGVLAWRQARIDRQLALERSAAELKPILDELRTSSSVEAFQPFEDWMARNVVRGRTTEEDIIFCFGKDSLNLDRPKRDAIRTIEFPLDKRISLKYRRPEAVQPIEFNVGDYFVVFDFDSQTGILEDWQISFGVCGYCPHVFANDGQWRLEGKMLAGRIGLAREGPDTLLLPRLVRQNHRLRIRLANWAPEVEYLDQVQLGVVPCQQDCEVDMDEAGHPYVWKETRTALIKSVPESAGRDGWIISVGEPESGRVIVLEARNTGAFEKAMRQVVFRPGNRWPPANLALGFDRGGNQQFAPLGTKFLRRVAVPIPREARTLHLSAPANMWSLRRAWLGQGQLAQGITWVSATDASGPEVDALRLLRDRDRHRLVLAPLQEVDLAFLAPRSAIEGQVQRFVLRMWGYYEVLSSALEGPEKR
jgi:hypothetical protein